MKTAAHIETEHQQTRSSCAYFPMENWCLSSASGKDTFSYLQTQTTNDVLELQVGQGQNSAITDRKARLMATFSIHRRAKDSVIFLSQKAQRDKFIKYLESFIFREDVHLATQLDQTSLIALQGPKSGLILKNIFDNATLPEKSNDITSYNLNGEEVLIINKSLTGEEGYVIAFSDYIKDKLIDLLHDAGEQFGLICIGPETWDVLRIEAGIPWYGKDMDENYTLPETGVAENCVSYNKGCYIGQEVIARVKTYGSPKFALIGLIIDGDALPSFGADIFLASKKIGTIKSAAFSYVLNKNIALAYILKDHRSPDNVLEVTIQEKPFTIKTALLPFYQPQTRTDHAKSLHEKALKFYKEEENLDKPIALLREAIDLDPKYAAAYEALGVFLSKQNKIDEAISLMKRLVELDPGEIMAHTNLSIFYMKQGRIEDAENEKAEATALQFERAMNERMAKKTKEQDLEKKRQEQQNKIEMFNKVLQIDPNDQVANFGLGSIYLDQGQFETALGPLTTLVSHFKDYSAAYLLLGKTFEKLSRKKDAIETYQNGIAAASKKGDLMPLKDMQSRLNQILQSSS